MAISTFTNLSAIQYLRRGDGIREIRDSRRKDRVFGAQGLGRLTAPSSGKTALTRVVDWRETTCLRAFACISAAMRAGMMPLLSPSFSIFAKNALVYVASNVSWTCWMSLAIVCGGTPSVGETRARAFTSATNLHNISADLFV